VPTSATRASTYTAAPRTARPPRTISALVADTHANWLPASETQTPGEPQFLEAFDADLGNIGEAITWALDRGDPDLALRISGGLFTFWVNAPVAADKLNPVKSNLKYGFALSLDNSEAIAANLAPYIALKRTPETLNKLYDLYASVTPQDIQAMAKKYFVENKRTTVVLMNKEKTNAGQ